MSVAQVLSYKVFICSEVISRLPIHYQDAQVYN